MPRSVITTLTAYDYKDLKQENSEKNIINQTFGDEYIIDLAQTTNITDINDASTEFDITPLGGGNYVNGYEYQSGRAQGIFVGQSLYSRNEYYRHSGSFTIETDEIITDTNSIAVKLTLEYDKYRDENDNHLSDSNYSSYLSAYKSIYSSTYKTNTSKLNATTNLPYETGGMRIITFSLFGIGETQMLSENYPTNYISYRVKKLTNDHYQITVYYNIVTWWGKSWAEGDKWGQSKSCDLWVATKLKFALTANTVSAREVEFEYARDESQNYSNAVGKNYNIDSNEFIQTDENTSPAQRTSYALSNEIFNAFDTDRAIVSFTLLNCEKYLIDGEYRYLRSEDLIYIQDENDELISDEINANGELVPSVFEIIKARPIWDGTFSMEIVCRKVDMTTN